MTFPWTATSRTAPTMADFPVKGGRRKDGHIHTRASRNVTAWITCAAILVFALFCPSAAQAQQERKSALGGLADLLGKALRTAIGEEVEEEAMAIDVMAGPGAKPAESEIQRRKSRVGAYTDTMQKWITDVCELSEEQQQGLRDIVAKEIEKSHLAWEKKDAQQANQQLHDTFPVKFTIRYGTAQSLDLTRHYKKLNDLLTEDQQAKLKAATAERQAFHIDAMVSRVLNMLDEELYLSSTQREEMLEPLKQRLNGMESSSFSFQAQNYYYQQQSIAFLLQRGDHLKCLNEAQRRRARDFADISDNGSYNSEQYILFQSNDGTDGWYRKLEDSCKEQRDRVYRACAVRSEFYQSEWDLPDEASRHLTVAGKGIADRVIAEWKKNIRRQLKSYEEQAGRFGGNFSFSMQVVDLKQLESDALWKHTVDSLREKGEADGYDRAALIRAKQAEFLTSMLDKEIWFTSTQRSQVQELVEKSLPLDNLQNPYRNYMDEVALLVIPLFKFSKKDASLFEGPQKAAWEALKNEFDFNGRYVMVHMKNGGQFHFQIPN